MEAEVVRIGVGQRVEVSDDELLRGIKQMDNSQIRRRPEARRGVVMETASVVLDVAEIERETAFWSSVLGEEPSPLRGEGGWVTVGLLDSTISLILQKVPEPKIVKNRCHMCFVVPDVDEAVRQIVALGGSRVSRPRSGGGVTMADPEGNEFCIGSFRRTKDGKRIPLT